MSQDDFLNLTVQEDERKDDAEIMQYEDSTV